MHTTQTGDEALIARLQERVRKLEETVAKHGQASSSARREVELSDSSVESELSEDEHVFNRLQVSRRTRGMPHCLAAMRLIISSPRRHRETLLTRSLTGRRENIGTTVRHQS
jgi:hypothetical protein